MPSISVIIRAYNEENHIGKLLSGICEQNLETEIILVDSGSTDATVSIASHYPIKIVSIKPEEFSFGRALNLGCSAASGDFLVFVSAHTYPVYEDWLEHMIQPFNDENVALVYGMQRGNEQSKYSERQLFKKWFPSNSDHNQTHPFCNNANCAIRKSLWLEQPYNELLTGLEDLDWAKRVMSVGHQIAYNALAEVIHVHEETSKKVLNRYRREAIAFKNIFPEHKFHFWDFLRLFVANIFSDSVQAIREKVFFRNFREIILFRLMQFWGTYLGTNQKSIDSSLKRRFYYPNPLKLDEKQVSDRRPINYSKHS